MHPYCCRSCCSCYCHQQEFIIQQGKDKNVKKEVEVIDLVSPPPKGEIEIVDLKGDEEPIFNVAAKEEEEDGIHPPPPPPLPPSPTSLLKKVTEEEMAELKKDLSLSSISSASKKSSSGSSSSSISSSSNSNSSGKKKIKILEDIKLTHQQLKITPVVAVGSAAATGNENAPPKKKIIIVEPSEADPTVRKRTKPMLPGGRKTQKREVLKSILNEN